MQLKKCQTCSEYTLKSNCPKCNKKTKETHYRYENLRDAPKDSAKHFDKIRNHIPKEERIKKYHS